MATVMEAGASGTTSPRRAALKTFFASPSGWVPVSVLIVLVLVAVFGPNLIDRPAGFTEDVLQPPSSTHWMGTNDLGQDVFAQIIWGTRTSMLVAVVASVIAIVIGTGLGIVAAYFRRIDAVVTMLTDVMLSLPILPLMIMVTAIAGPSILTLILVIGFFSWMEVTRLIRSNAMVVMGMPLIDGARSLGSGACRIMTRELLPMVSPLIVVNILLTAARAVISEAGLSFLGLGDPDTWSWGRILSDAQRSGLLAVAWWQTLFPSLLILVLVLSATLAGMRYNDVRSEKFAGV